jgi:sugar O-acyltransferase (sialic acid O-acetyltransferase NeuD family)
MERALFGAGGFCHDIRALTGNFHMPSFVDDKYWDPNNDNIMPISKYDPKRYELLIAVSDPMEREKIVGRLPKETKYWSFIHPSAQILNPSGEIGEGTVISANCVIVCHYKLGNHVHFNIGTVLGHDSVVGDYCTTAPGAMIMGDCRIGERVYFGANSCCSQKITICNDVTIGLGAVVVRNISEPGTYVGIPVKKIK